MNRKTQMNAMVVAASGALGLLVALLFGARVESLRFERFQEGLRAVSVQHPQRRPIPSQSDLDIALALFSIDVPSQIAPVRFDPELEDRGLTTGSTLGGASEVLIGPAAFSSWAILGSTLGHEIEVHLRQSFLAIVLQDEFSDLIRPLTRFPLEWDVAAASEQRPSGFGAGLPGIAQSARSSRTGFWESACTSCGTWQAEREAYEYELSQASRFGLSSGEAELIRQVMETYYPAQGGR